MAKSTTTKKKKKKKSSLGETAVPFNDKDFQAEQDMRALIDAEKIKRDPKRLAAAKAKAEEQRKALASVTSTKAKEA